MASFPRKPKSMQALKDLDAVVYGFNKLSCFVLLFYCVSTWANAAGTRAMAPAFKEELSVEITTHLGDEQEFHQGDELTFLVNLNRAAYLTIIFQDASGKLMQILPNKNRQAHLFESGMYFLVPDDQDPFHYRVAPPYGKEVVHVFASAQPLPEFSGKVLGNGLRQLSGSYEDLNHTMQVLQKEQGIVVTSGLTRITTRP